MNEHFRQIGTEDIAEVRALARRIWEEAYGDLLPEGQIDYMLALMYSEDVIRQELAGGVAWELIIDGGRPCGFLSYAPAEGNSVKLSKIYVEKSARGGPLVSEAIDRVVHYAAEQGGTTVFLTVNKGNRRAIRAYEKRGFKITSSVVTDIGGGFVMDDHIMTRDVEEGGSID